MRFLNRFETTGKVLDYARIPFAHPGDKDELKKSCKHRSKVFRKFIGRDISALHTLDIGSQNAFGLTIGIKDNTLPGDLNHTFEAPSKDYDLILFSETFEHLVNPYLAMSRVYDLLKSGGVCILSTPILSWQSMRGGSRHFIEYRPKQLGIFFEYMGFEVVKYKKHMMWDYSFMFCGVRPFFRVLTHRWQLWMLRKP